LQKKPKEVNLLLIGAIVLGVIAIIIVFMLPSPSNTDANPGTTTVPTVNTEEPGADATTVPGTTAPATTAQTEPEVIYEKQTVYLCVRTTMENWNEPGVHETLYTYDEYGNSIKSENMSSGSWTLSEYDDWGNLLIQQSYRSDGSKGGRYEYTYDENGLMLTQKYFSADGTLFSEYTYTYDDTDRLIKETYKYSENDYLYEYSYSDDGSECRMNTYNHGELTGYTIDRFNSDGLMIERNSYKADDAWRYRKTCEYDEQGRLVLEWNYDSNELQADYDVIYTYDENGLLVYKNVDYYYGYGLRYFYEAFQILVRVQ